MKNEFEKLVCQAVDDVLQFGIVNGSAAFNEATPEDTIITLVQAFPIHHDVATIIRLVRHHDHDGVSFGVVDSLDHGSSNTVRARVPDGDKFQNAALHRNQKVACAVGAAVVYDNDFMGNSVDAELNLEVFDGRTDTTIFVVGWDHYR